MKNYIFYILLLLLASLGMVSCTEHEIFETDKGKSIRITASCVNLNTTRAEGDAETTKPGEEYLNENLISTIHYFLYPEGGTNANAVLVGKITNIGQHGSATIDIPLVEEVLNKNLFPGTNRECEVYLIANFPNASNLESLSDTRVETLQALALTAFDNGSEGTGGVRNPATFDEQESFVMDGLGTILLDNRSETTVAEASITLKRFAAKYTICISTETSFTEKVKDDGGEEYDKVWKPVRDEMKVRVKNVVSNTTLKGVFGTNLFEYAPRVNVDGLTKEIGNKEYDVFNPFYSYPCQWEIHKDDALAIYVELPWEHVKNDGTSERTTCLYKVIPNTTQLNRNSWYNINLNIGVLSINPEEVEKYIEITGSCSVVDWNNDNDDWVCGLAINSEIKGARYLIVEQNEYVVNNQNELEIPFISSHECIIKDYSANSDGNPANDFKVTKKIFIKDGKPVNEDDDITGDARAGNWITIVGNTIKLNHTLNNNFESTSNKNYDYTPYTFTFTICHKDNQDNFQEKITIIQKPAISVTAELNSKYIKNSNENNGYVFVNANSVPNYGETNNSYDFGGVGNLTATSGNNSNPYMYTIEISVLPNDSKYILGDPRVKYDWTSDDMNEFAEAPALEGRTPRKLSNYYGTNKDVSFENMIAPKFRISSAHGRVTKNPLPTHSIALKRSATYQEDGYPAGRWRLPTMAEIKFVAKLYADTHIPPLFSSGTGYWCASGSVTPSNTGSVTINNNTSRGNCALRSVYDVWYWENSPVNRLPQDKYTQFTWGDEVQQTN
ncbi:MAG: hypothetical protein IKU85_06745 [Bacteroidaceae bacterium]|nr:hypothetical protein [Bacteroidaceae bacterium]